MDYCKLKRKKDIWVRIDTHENSYRVRNLDLQVEKSCISKYLIIWAATLSLKKAPPQDIPIMYLNSISTGRLMLRMLHPDGQMKNLRLLLPNPDSLNFECVLSNL